MEIEGETNYFQREDTFSVNFNKMAKTVRKTAYNNDVDYLRKELELDDNMPSKTIRKNVAKFKLSQMGESSDDFDIKKKHDFVEYHSDRYDGKVILNSDQSIMIVDGVPDEHIREDLGVNNFTKKVFPMGLTCVDDEYYNKKICVVFFRDEGQSTLTAVNVDDISDVLKHTGGEKNITYYTSDKLFDDLFLVNQKDDDEQESILVVREPININNNNEISDNIKIDAPLHILPSTLAYMSGKFRGVSEKMFSDLESDSQVRGKRRRNIEITFR